MITDFQTDYQISIIDIIERLLAINLPYLFMSLVFGMGMIYLIPSLRIHSKKLFTNVFIIDLILLIIINALSFVLRGTNYPKYVGDNGIFIIPAVMLLVQSIFLYKIMDRQIKYYELLILSIIMAIGGVLGVFLMLMIAFSSGIY